MAEPPSGHTGDHSVIGTPWRKGNHRRHQVANTPPGHEGDLSVKGSPELPILAPDPISPEVFRPGSRKASSVASSINSSSHDQLEMDVIEQQLLAAEANKRVAAADAQVEELKLQLAKRKLLASSHGSNASGKHADKYLRAHQSPGIDNTMTDKQPADPNGPCAADQYSLTTENLSKLARAPRSKGPQFLLTTEHPSKLEGVPCPKGPPLSVRPQVFAISSPPTRAPDNVGPSAADTPGMAAQRLSIQHAAHTVTEERKAVIRAEEHVAQQAGKVDEDYHGRRREIELLEQQLALTASNAEAKLQYAQEMVDNKAQMAHEELSAAMRASKDRDTVQRLQIKEEAAAEYRTAINGLEMQQRNEANTLRASLEQEALSSVRQQVQSVKEAQEQQQADILRRASEEILERDRQLASLKAAALASDEARRS